MTRQTIAVVGAGLAGLRAAERLLDAGAQVTLLEKSRGPGGRCATRRSPVGPFDHGAGAFQARTPAFQAAVAAAAAQGLLHAAPAGQRLLDLDPGPSDAPAWRGAPFMNAWPQALRERLVGRGLRMLTEATVRGLRRESTGWLLELAEDPARAALGDPRFDAVLLAVPAEQAVPLLQPHDPTQAALLAACRSEACITLMAAWTDPQPGGPHLLRPAEGPLALAFRQDAFDTGAADRAPTRWTAHARADWSLAAIDTPPEALLAPMLHALRDALGEAAPGGEPAHAAVHRWRYAQLLQAAAAPCGWSAALGLGSCGDGWQGSPEAAMPLDGLERAWLSAGALVDRVLGG